MPDMEGEKLEAQRDKMEQNASQLLHDDKTPLMVGQVFAVAQFLEAIQKPDITAKELVASEKKLTENLAKAGITESNNSNVMFIAGAANAIEANGRNKQDGLDSDRKPQTRTDLNWDTTPAAPPVNKQADPITADLAARQAALDAQKPAANTRTDLNWDTAPAAQQFVVTKRPDFKP